MAGSPTSSIGPSILDTPSAMHVTKNVVTSEVSPTVHILVHENLVSAPLTSALVVVEHDPIPVILVLPGEEGNAEEGNVIDVDNPKNLKDIGASLGPLAIYITSFQAHS